MIALLLVDKPKRGGIVLHMGMALIGATHCDFAIVRWLTCNFDTPQIAIVERVGDLKK